MEKNSNEKGAITLILGKSFSMYGVNDIRGFEPTFIALDTEFGCVSIEGDDLKIEDLSKETTRIFITGNVSGIFLSASTENKKGIFKRLFS